MIRIILAAACILTLPACATYTPSPALCTMDLECMRLCAPVDLECDGGPQTRIFVASQPSSKVPNFSGLYRID